MNVGVSITVNMRTIYGNAVLASNVAGSAHGAAQPGLSMNPSTVNTDTLLRLSRLATQSLNVSQRIPPPAGCSKSSSSEAAGESKPEAYPQGYVEDFDEPRTKLAGFFSILLN